MMTSLEAVTMMWISTVLCYYMFYVSVRQPLCSGKEKTGKPGVIW